MNNKGRPPKYKTSEEMQTAIDLYFLSVEEDHLTLTGLALALDFESRQSLYDYEVKGDFAYTIKKARLRIENSYEISLRENGRSGDIFALKNFGWKDKQEIEQTGNMQINIGKEFNGI